MDSGTGYSVIWELARGFGALVNGGKYLVSLDTVEITLVRQAMNEHVHERQ